ncbi:MAG: hypothetical protein QOE27_2203 [Solirubrobacteraceae bacterium]|nr:hypothetical protein [Solirubrobacteraceae bacterium]
MRKQRAERLRFAVESLPPDTQRAMLQGIKENRIVTGANTDRRGGVCPMLAADRNSFEITPLAEIFATAWDHYTGTTFVNVTRRAASDRDLNVLRTMLETSLALNDAAAPSLVAAAGEIRGQAAPQPVARPDLVDTSRTLTAAARLEVMRALEATGHPAPAPASWLDAAPASAPSPARTRAPRAPSRPARTPDRPTTTTRLDPAPPTRRSGRVEPFRAVAAGRVPAGSGASNKTQAELDRERARAIIANQAAALRPRAWPRSAETTANPPQPIAAAPAPAPAPAPAGPVDRNRELQERSGWAWLRPFSSYDDYEQTLHDLGEMDRRPGTDDPRTDDGGHHHDTKRREPTPA